MDVIHKRRPQAAATTLALNSFSLAPKGYERSEYKAAPNEYLVPVVDYALFDELQRWNEVAGLA